VIAADRVRGGGTVRGLCRTNDGRLALADGDRVVMLDASAAAPDAVAFEPLGAEITGLLAWESALLIGTADGRVLRCEPADPTAWRPLCRAEDAVTGMAVLAAEPPRLVLADGGMGLRCRVLGEAARIETLYGAGDKRCRWVAVAGDYLYAGTADRTGVLAWRVGEPLEPAHWINVRRLTGHSLADLAVVRE
jgi:hypothetical protein